MIRALLAALAVAAAVLVLAAPAGAARECNGFQVCVPVAGPWVLSTSRTETQYQLACPKRFVVGGLDAELTNPAIDLVFRATLGPRQFWTCAPAHASSAAQSSGKASVIAPGPHWNSASFRPWR